MQSSTPAAAAPSTVESSSNTAPALDPAFKSRSVNQLVLSQEQSEGVGARVRRSIGRPELRQFSPFVMLDEFKAGPVGGFPDHAHRGFETVTYMLPGSTGAFEHEDFTGTKGRLSAGSLQWMTAGRGIVHSEMPAHDMKPTDIAWGLQLWINLRAKDKFCEPRYQELPPEQVPKVTRGGVEAHVIAGTALGTTSPIYTRTPVEYIHYYLQPGAAVQHRIPKGFNSFLYTLTGKIAVGDGEAADKKPIDAHHTVTLTNEASADGVTIRALDGPADFVLLAGEPIDEPTVQYGPFVLNSRQQVMEAIRDYQEGKNGFERAPGWRSEIGRPITDHM